MINKYIVKICGPDATPHLGEEMYECATLEEVSKEIGFQRTAFPNSCVYCVEKDTGNRVEV